METDTYFEQALGWVSPENPDANFLPVSAARASFGKECKTGEDEKADIKLMKYLADHQHMTPFEYNHATFLIECPLFVLSQIKTHRTNKCLDLATNVISRRYTSEDIAFWKPDKWRKQSTSNKQASTDEEVDVTERWGKHGSSLPYEHSVEIALESYNWLLSSGVCREQARAVLPEATLTRLYLGGTLRNWVHFLTLRQDPTAQYEIRVIADRIATKLRELWPEAMGVLLPIEES
jgi:thymidylate synthase (FAD)